MQQTGLGQLRCRHREVNYAAVKRTFRAGMNLSLRKDGQHGEMAGHKHGLQKVLKPIHRLNPHSDLFKSVLRHSLHDPYAEV